MTEKPGKVIGLKVEYTNPEEMAKNLAISLGEALVTEANKRRDADEYARMANEWERRAEKTRELLSRVRKRDAGEPVETTSRMDPVLTYTAEAVEAQYAEERRRVKEFRAKVQEFLNEADRAHKDTIQLQKRLAKGQP